MWKLLQFWWARSLWHPPEWPVSLLWRCGTARCGSECRGLPERSSDLGFVTQQCVCTGCHVVYGQQCTFSLKVCSLGNTQSIWLREKTTDHPILPRLFCICETAPHEINFIKYFTVESKRSINLITRASQKWDSGVEDCRGGNFNSFIIDIYVHKIILIFVGIPTAFFFLFDKFCAFSRTAFEFLILMSCWQKSCHLVLSYRLICTYSTCMT